MEKSGNRPAAGSQVNPHQPSTNHISNGARAPLEPLGVQGTIRDLLAAGKGSEVLALISSLPNGIADIEEMLHGKEEMRVRQGAALVMLNHYLNCGDWDSIANLLDPKRPEVCSASAYALSKVTGSLEISSPVLDALSENLFGGSTPELARNSALALAGAARNERTHQAAISILGNALSDRYPEAVRLAAAAALGGIAADTDIISAMIPLGKASSDKKSGAVRKACTSALFSAARNSRTSESALTTLAQGMGRAKTREVRLDYARSFAESAKDGIDIYPVIGIIATALSSEKKQTEARLAMLDAIITFSLEGGDIFAAINVLGRAFAEKDPGISSKSCEALTLAAASASDPKTRQLAISTLGNLVQVNDRRGTSLRAADALYDVVHATDDAKTKQLAIVTLSNSLSGRSSPRWKVNALNALARLSGEGVNTSYAMDSLSNSIMEGKAALKKIAAWVLGNMAMHYFDIFSATTALTHAMEKGDEEVRLNAAWALRNAAKTGTRILPALPAIARMLSGKRQPGNIQNYCGEALWAAVLNPRSRTEAIHALGAALSSSNASWKTVWVAKNAVNAGIELAQATEGLASALAHRDAFVRQDAAETLSIMAEKNFRIPQSVKEALLLAKSDRDPDTRFYAELALKKLQGG